MNEQERNHHANQCNPNNAANKAARDNHANQLNPNNSRYSGNTKSATQKD